MEELHLPSPDESLGAILARQKYVLPSGKKPGRFSIRNRLQNMLEDKQEENQKGTRSKVKRTNGFRSKIFAGLLRTYRAKSARGRVESSESKGMSPRVWRERPSSSRQASDKHRFGGPKWGATEGGRDHLVLVRKLVKYTETSPVFFPSDGCANVEVSCDREGWTQTIFPSQNPDKREDTKLLSCWIQDMMANLDLSADESLGHGEDGVENLADAAIWIYQTAFEELSKQIGTECRDRSDLLRALWEQYSALIQLRSDIEHENELACTQMEFKQAEKAKEDLSAEKQRVHEKIEKLHADYLGEKKLCEQQKEHLVNKLVKSRMDLQDQEQECRVTVATLKEEIEKRLETDGELNRSRMLLSKTKQEEIDSRCCLNRLKLQHADLEEKHNLVISDMRDMQASLESEKVYSKSLLRDKNDLEIEYRRMRCEYEANDIIVMSLKEQLRLRDQHMITLKMTFESNKQKLQNHNNKIEQLQFQVKALEEALTTATNENEGVKGDNEKLEEQLRDEKTCSLSTIHGLEDRICLLEQKVAQSQEDVRSRTHELEHVKMELKHAISRMENEEQNAISAKTELHHVRSQLTAMATSMGKAARATGNQALLEKIDGISSDCPDEEYASSMSNLLATEMEASTSPRENSAATGFLGVIQLAENQLKDLGAEVAALKQRATLAESLFSCETDTRKKLQAQLQDAKTDRARAIRECDRSRKRISTLEDEIRPMRSQEKKLSNQVDQLNNKLNSLIPECDRLREDNEKLLPNVGKVARLEVENCKLQKTIAAKDHELTTVDAKIENLRAEIELLRLEKEDLEENIEGQVVNKEQISSLSQDVGELLQERETLFDEVEKLQQENRSIKVTLRVTKKQLGVAQFLLKGLNVNADKVPSAADDGDPLFGCSDSSSSEGMGRRKSLRARSMSIFGTQDTRMTGSPAAMLLKEGSAEFQQLVKQSTGRDVSAEALPSTIKELGNIQLTRTSQEGTDSSDAVSSRALDVSTQKKLQRSGAAAVEPEKSTILLETSTTVVETDLDQADAPSLPASSAHTNSSELVAALPQQVKPKSKSLKHSGSRVRFEEPIVAHSDSRPGHQIDRESETVVIQHRATPDSDGRVQSREPSSTPTADTPTAKRRESVSGRTLSGVLAGYKAPGVKLRDLHFTVPASERKETPIRTADTTDGVPGIISQKSLDAHDMKWQNLKISMLAWFSRNLRIRLREETRARLQAQIDKCNMEKKLLKAACKREAELVKWVTKSVIPSWHALSGTEILIQEVRAGANDILAEVDVLNEHTCLLAKGLRIWNEKFDGRKDMATQSSDATVVQWIDFIRKLPKSGTEKPISHDALLETIVKIYHRKLVKIQQFGCEDLPSSSIFEAIEDHYLTQRKKGVMVEAIRSKDGPVARVLLSCRLFPNHPKVRMFASFTGINEEYLPPEAWHFFLMVLDCLRNLLDINWKAAIREWAAPSSTLVPLQCVLDLLGNLYNAEQPALLDVMTVRLLGLVQLSDIGPCIDLDLLLMVIMNEYTSGECPRNPLRHPRRCTDGSLPNLLNLASTPSADDPPVFDASKKGSTSDIPRSPDIFNNFHAIESQALAKHGWGASLARKPSSLL